MRHVTLNELADQIRKDFKLTVPKSVVRKLIKHHFKYIIQIIKAKKDRIRLYKSDVHTVYGDFDLKKLCGELADLDETKTPVRTKKTDTVVKHNGFTDPMPTQRKFAKRMDKVGHHLIPELNA